MVRSFSLIDRSGNELDLLDINHFFQYPEGLGFEKNIDVMNLSEDYVISSETITQKLISGTMVFSSNQMYSRFNTFTKNEPLYLKYRPAGILPYLIDVKINSLTKTELNPARRLECDIEFLCISLWYKKIEIKTTDIPSENNKIYRYKYPYKYIENTATKIILDNNGDIETPLYVEIFGSVQDVAYFVKQNENLIGNCKINCDIPIGNKLVINSTFSSPEISEYTISNDYVQNLYTNSDLNTTRFIRLPKGQSVFSFTSKNATYPQIQLSYKEYYATV